MVKKPPRDSSDHPWPQEKTQDEKQCPDGQLVLFSGDKEDKIEAEEVETNEGSENEDEGEGEKLKRRGAEKRVRLPIYQKLLAVREVDRLVEEGVEVWLGKESHGPLPWNVHGDQRQDEIGDAGQVDRSGRWAGVAKDTIWKDVCGRPKAQGPTRLD